MATDLPDLKAIDVVRAAHSHLHAALVQVTPSDDKIIVEHMQSAETLLKAVLDADRGGK